MLIPEIRERLRELSRLHAIPELKRLADQLERRKGSRAPNTSEPMTPKLAAAIRAYAAAHPRTPQTVIATLFNVNPGRVSEAIKGKRT